MLDDKLMQVISTPPDAAVTLVTQGQDGAHLVNSWNSYLRVSEEGDLLFPVGGMRQTEQNLAGNDRIKLSIANREVQGLRYKGTGFILEGRAVILDQGPAFQLIKADFPWARAVLKISPISWEQTL